MGTPGFYIDKLFLFLLLRYGGNDSLCTGFPSFVEVVVVVVEKCYSMTVCW